MRYRRYGKECKFNWQTIYETCRNDREHCNKPFLTSIRNLTADEEQRNWLQKQNYFKISGFKLQTPWGRNERCGHEGRAKLHRNIKTLSRPKSPKRISKLQRQAPAMPFAAIQQQVERELGKPLKLPLNLFEQEPLLLHRLASSQSCLAKWRTSCG